jgi:hypothetical protein
MGIQIEIDGRGWHYAQVESFQVYGNRFLGSTGGVYWKASVSGEHGPVNCSWISDGAFHRVSMHPIADSSGRSEIIVHGVAEGITDGERNAISKAIETWEARLAEHEQRSLSLMVA